MLKNVRSRFNDALARITWQDFERTLADYYREQGFRVEHIGTGGNQKRYDGGVDLKLHKEDKVVLVQCKHWNTKKVPHNDVHQLIGIMVNESAAGSILITSGEFTEAAKAAASKQGHVKLIDGRMLRTMLESRIETLASKNPTTAPAVITVSNNGGRSFPEKEKHLPTTQATEDTGLGKMLAGIVLVFFLYVGTRCSSNRQLPQPQATAPAIKSNDPLETLSVQLPSTVGNVKPVPVSQPAEPEKLDMEEWKKKNAESMKILEATTPEVRD